MRTLYDAAYPPNQPPRVDGVAGYVGGGTPHVWTDREWADQTSKSGARYWLPIFTRVPPTRHNPVSEALYCASWLTLHGAPPGVCMALDYETAVRDDADGTTYDPDDYLRAFDATMVGKGYRTLVYGSKSTVFGLPKPSGGYWSAHWTNEPHLCAGAAMTQYGGDVTIGQPYDLNVAADGVPLWDRKGGTMSAGGPEHWDAADWAAFDARVREVLRGVFPLAGNAQGTRSWGEMFVLTYYAARTAAAGVLTSDALADAIAAKLPEDLGDLTPDQVKGLVKDAIREGTGSG